jgi:hypothetical protein
VPTLAPSENIEKQVQANVDGGETFAFANVSRIEVKL